MPRARCIVNSTDHKAEVTQLAFSEQSEGNYYLASASKDGKVMLRLGSTGECVGYFEMHGKAMLCVDISANATQLVTGSEDGFVCIWNTCNGKQLTNFKEISPVNCVALAKNSPYLAVGCLDRHSKHTDDDVLYVYPIDHANMPTYCGGHSRGVRDVIFCRNDRTLLTSSHDRIIRYFDRVSGTEVHSVVLPHHAKSLQLNEDGRTVTIAYGQSIVFLDVERFKVLYHRRFTDHITGASLHPQKKSYVCSSGNRIYKFDYHSGELIESFLAHDQPVRSIKYSPDSDVFATASIDGEVRLWQNMSDRKFALWYTEKLAAQENEQRQQSESESSSSSSNL